MYRLLPGLVLLAWLAIVPTGAALGPNDVWLVVNSRVPTSRALAEYYCAKRGVPKDHIVELDLPTGEDIDRTSYDSKLAAPLRKHLEDKKEQVKVLLTIHGVPLRVGRGEPTAQDKEKLDELRKGREPLAKEQASLQKDIEALEKSKPDPKSDEGKNLADKKKKRDEINRQLRGTDDQIRWLAHQESVAAVDSELALLWHPPYELRRWQMNPLYFQIPEKNRTQKPALVMTCRLDGPDVKLLEKLIDQSIEVEKKGLTGKVYVDARGIGFDSARDGGFGYGGYDESLREMARLLEKDAGLPVVLDNKGELFTPGSCPDAALYCGWYALARYVPCCQFAPGAVAYHIASSEAVSLRNPKATLWCPNLLKDGVVATLGPVAEPYTVGFPKPAEFFGFLVTGEYTLVECHWRTVLFASWMTTLVGDPLYNPYQKSPKLKSAQVLPSPQKKP